MENRYKISILRIPITFGMLEQMREFNLETKITQIAIQAFADAIDDAQRKEDREFMETKIYDEDGK